MFKLKIKTDNAAFSENPSAEVARILRDTISKLEQGNTTGKLLDFNGNLVGEFTLTKR